jgi:LmbE family N-acetylglucosaminyl deacetylase
MRPASSYLLDWLGALDPSEIHVVSPHLDDAVLSVHGLLSSRFAATCYVTTVFTAAAPDGGDEWAKSTGFRDAAEEFAVRCEEDRRAMARLGVRYRHSGMHPDAWDDSVALDLARQLVPDEALRSDMAPRPFVWLPAAAGQPLSGLKRTMRRVLRKPLGSDTHPEHRVVRDGLWHAFRRRGFDRIGFYAEIPYLCSDRSARLSRSLQALCGEPLELFTIVPQARHKLEVVSEYASQLKPILGTKLSYQLRVLRQPELFLVPLGLASPVQIAAGPATA